MASFVIAAMLLVGSCICNEEDKESKCQQRCIVKFNTSLFLIVIGSLSMTTFMIMKYWSKVRKKDETN